MGPRSPVIAVVGAEAKFPCHLSPSTDAQHMEVRWFHGNHSGLVHYYRDSKDYLEQQRPEYHGRTELLRENITRGQVALRIHPIRPADEGDYRCLFVSSTYHNEARFHVEVTEGLFPSSCTWMVVLAVLISVLVLAAAICAVFLLARKDKGLNKIRKFAEDIILDKDTAHPYLAVSPDGKCVKSVTKKQDVPDKPERFDTMPAVLGQNRFSSGSHYWEAEVAGNSKWTFGICVESVNRKGQYISAKTQSGFWTLCLKDGTYKALSVSHHVLQVTGPLLRVGIFLQYKEGLISFYNVTDCTILHTFKSEFTEPLRPYFYPEPAGLLKEQHAKLEEECADITLDAATAHPYLAVTDDGKCVTYVPERQDVPDNPERFDTLVGVLGRNRFSGGDHYWEVGVAGKSMWAVGLCLESVRRKGQYTKACPETGFWILRLQNGECSAFATPRTVVTREPLSRLGVFLEYEKGLISFYNVTQFVILFTFKSNFKSEPLRP
ncbi:butyrophilin subfamily 1 member A1-like [Callospermophilus lateralis]|uniref:butyrophilin subfamily 1 member A1-like n=1 Tax=Callospermophilus lateralis TaxID=76772 RepID=UPI00405446A1